MHVVRCIKGQGAICCLLAGLYVIVSQEVSISLLQLVPFFLLYVHATVCFLSFYGKGRAGCCPSLEVAHDVVKAYFFLPLPLGVVASGGVLTAPLRESFHNVFSAGYEWPNCR